MNEKKLELLLERLEAADDAYYNSDAPIMTDREYDKKMDRLASLDLKSFSKSLQTKVKKRLQSIGAKPRQSKRNFTLPFEIRSLEKVTTDKPEKIAAFIKRSKDKKFFASPKLDGTSLTLHYYKGKLVNALTRGDGTTGTEKLEHAKHNSTVLNKIPKELATFKGVKLSKDLYIRCEACLYLPEFSTWNKKEKRYTSDRNPVAGWINSDSPSDKVSEFIHVIPLDVTDEKGNPIFESKAQALEYFRELGIAPESLAAAFRTVSAQQLTTALNKGLATLKELPYLCDGYVYEVNDTAARVALDKKKPNRPKYIYAYKTAATDEDYAVTKVTDITFTPSKIGVLAPTIHFKPVTLGKSNIAKATGDNFSLLSSRGIGVGSKIKVVRAGGVIPKAFLYSDKYKKGAKEILPKKCLCGAKAIQPDIDMANGKSKKSPHLYCSKPRKCKYVQRALLEHALKTLKLTGVGVKNIDVLFEAGYCTVVSLLKADPKELLELPRFGESLVATLTQGLRERLGGADSTTHKEISGVFTKPGLSLAWKSINDIETGKLTQGVKHDFYYERLPQYRKAKKLLGL